jgi:hypothetical protein
MLKSDKINTATDKNIKQSETLQNPLHNHSIFVSSPVEKDADHNTKDKIKGEPKNNSPKKHS